MPAAPRPATPRRRAPAPPSPRSRLRKRHQKSAVERASPSPSSPTYNTAAQGSARALELTGGRGEALGGPPHRSDQPSGRAAAETESRCGRLVAAFDRARRPAGHREPTEPMLSTASIDANQAANASGLGAGSMPAAPRPAVLRRPAPAPPSPPSRWRARATEMEGWAAQERVYGALRGAVQPAWTLRRGLTRWRLDLRL